MGHSSYEEAALSTVPPVDKKGSETFFGKSISTVIMEMCQAGADAVLTPYKRFQVKENIWD